MLKIYDNQIQNKEDIFKEICSLPYNFGETDNVDSKPTGLTTELSETTLTYKSIHAIVKENETLKDKIIHRSFVNLFIPGEYANYHTDGSSKEYTLLYYANLNFDLDEDGETKFLSENNTLSSILPIPGRIIVFPADYKHTASPYRTQHRFTVAFKFKEKT